MTFADWLRQQREARGMSQRGLSLASGLTENVVNRIETGYLSRPSAMTLAALARGLGVQETLVFIAAGRLPGDIQEFLMTRQDGLDILRRAIEDAA